MFTARTVNELFNARVAATPDEIAYRYPLANANGADDWVDMTWSEAARRIRRIAGGLIALGIEPGDRVAIMADTGINWVMANFGALAAGAAVTAVYPSTKPEGVEYILRDSGAKAVFVENSAQLGKLAECGPAGAAVSKVVFDGTSDRKASVISLRGLEVLGSDRIADNVGAFERIYREISGSSLATLIYTSGTTGNPKGVELTHDVWVAQAEAQVGVELLLPTDVQFLWLPLSHSFGSVLLLGQLQVGFVTAIDGRIDRIIENLAVVRPTFMAAAPRVYEKVMQGIIDGAEKLPRFVRSLFKRALARSIARQWRRFAAGKPYRGSAGLDALILAKVKRRFGGRIRMFVSGGARLDPEVTVFFAAIGVPILEGYGLTETAGASAINKLETLMPGTVGPVMPGTEMRILRADPADRDGDGGRDSGRDGEILFRGRGVMRGYWGRTDATAAVIDEHGWFHTGDKGYTDKAGRLRITGRIKDQFKTSNGKYVDPEKISATLTTDCPLIGQAVVVGEGRTYCVALIALEPDVARNWARQRDITADAATLTALGLVRDEIQRAIDRYNAQPSVERWETIKKFAIMPESPTVENGLMTPSMKVKRSAVIDRQSDLVEGMYA